MSLLLALAFISTLKIEGREAKVITDVYGVLTSVGYRLYAEPWRFDL